MRGFLRVKNWQQFQHYRDRAPKWIKLHRAILDDYDFHCLPVASKALAPCLWLLASEYDDGAIPYEPPAIAFRLRMDEASLLSALKSLIERGFFVLEQGASGALAAGEQRASLESEREGETEERREEEETARQAAPADEEPGHEPAPARRSSRGTRLPPDWLPDANERAFAESFGLNADVVAEEFRDFWHGVPGQRGCKLDWPATFRNRCREIAGRGGGRRGANGSGLQDGGAGVVAAAARVGRRLGLV